MDNKRSFRDNVVRLAALIGLILVLLLGAWGAIILALNLPTIANNIGNSVVSLFNPGTSTTTPSDAINIAELNVSAPASVKSGSSFVLSWDAAAGKTYSISYACQNGLSVKVPMPNGNYQVAPCATAFNYVNATNKMTLIPTITGSKAMDLSVFVNASNSDNVVTDSGSSILSVTPASTVSNTNTGTASTGSTNTGTNATTYVPAPRTQNLYGNPDLAVHITSINPISYQQNRVSVVFEVENIGTNVAPAGWVLNANLPVGYSYLYTSAAQQALYPGDKIVFTLGYNSAVNNQYCTQQYPNANCPWYQQPYNPYPYQGTCYRYDGYQNMPTACPSDINPNYDYYNTGYNNTNYSNGYNYQYGYNSGYNYSYYQGRLVTITIDPRNWLADYNRANNTASINSPIGY